MALLLHNQEVLVSYLVPSTGYIYKIYSCPLLINPGSSKDSIHIQATVALLWLLISSHYSTLLRIKNQVCWDATLCGWTCIFRRFESTALAQRHIVTPRKIQVFNNTAVRTWNLTLYKLSHSYPVKFQILLPPDGISRSYYWWRIRYDPTVRTTTMLAPKEVQTDIQNTKFDDSRSVTSKLIWFGEALRSHTQVGFPPRCSWPRRTTAVPHITKNRLKCQQFSVDSLKINMWCRASITCWLLSANSDYQLRHACLPVCPTAWNSSAPTGQTFVKFYWKIFPTSAQEFHVSIKSEENKWYFTSMAIWCFFDRAS